MKNPYEGIDWDSIEHVGSLSHAHITTQTALEYGCRNRIRHFAISNYYPSAPYDEDTKLSDFKLRQHWPARYTSGQGELDPPINWNDLITWKDDLADEF